MAKRVFFSFHYQDVIDFRANVVRQHWVTKPDREAAGFFDASLWESAKRTGETAIKRLINDGLNGTSATCVLIGSETYARPWVRYELLKSFQKGNSIFAVHINDIKDKSQKTKALGPNPLEFTGVTFSDDGLSGKLWEKTNGQWVEYSKIDGSSTYTTANVGPLYRGKGFNLSNFYRTYDWVSDDGFIQFSNWVG